MFRPASINADLHLKDSFMCNRFFSVMLLVFQVITTDLFSAPAGHGSVRSIPGYRLLGYEGDVINVTQRANIAYGADGSYVILYGIKGTVQISNSFFGDPKPGEGKAAYYKLINEEAAKEHMQGPDGYWFLGREGDSVRLKETADLAYGLGGKLRFQKNQTGRITLTNTFFHGDPAPGIPKYAWIKFSQTADLLDRDDPKAVDMFIHPEFEQGEVVGNSNPALSDSYRFKEYKFPEKNGHAKFTGFRNKTARIHDVFFAQTHVMKPSHPFFFLIADRPALIEVLVTGKGKSGDVSVTGYLNGRETGTIFMQGPRRLRNTVNGKNHNFDDRFTTTIPSDWMKPGLSLKVNAGSDERHFSAKELGVEFSPELNLVMVNIDVLDFNQGREDIKIPEDFLANFASAMPAAKTRLGFLPARLKLPVLAVHKDGSRAPVILKSSKDVKGVHAGNINGAALRFIHALKFATGDYSYAYYYGNTQHFNPGGWGGGKAFVGADFAGVFLHEMGHALSLPHWSNAYGKRIVKEHEYNYPYRGRTGKGGGRGESWNFYQNTHEYVSPKIEIDNHKHFGTERSDAMQRANHSPERRKYGPGLWDGFGDFSAIAMFRFMTGAPEIYKGSVAYRNNRSPFHLNKQPGFPELQSGGPSGRQLIRENARITTRHSWEKYDFYVPQKWNTPVYTVYGTYHPKYKQANILYEPMKYNGNLPALIDPTDPGTFAKLADQNTPYEGHFWSEKDLTFKFIYEDGTAVHAVYPYDGVSRNAKFANHQWRNDLLYFAINVPAGKRLKRIELYHRPFCVRNPDMNDKGNIRNQSLGITPENFMKNARLIMARDL